MVPVLSQMSAADSCMSQLEAARVRSTSTHFVMDHSWIHSCLFIGCHESGTHDGTRGDKQSVPSTH